MLHTGGRRLPRRQVPLAELMLDLGIPDHDKAPRLSVAATRRMDGGGQHRLNGLVGHGLRAEVAYRPLTVNGVKERHVFLVMWNSPLPHTV